MHKLFKPLKTTWWRLGVTLVALGLAVLAIWFWTSSSNSVAVTLSDGTKLKLIAVRYGKVPAYLPDAAPLKRFWWEVRSRMPARWGHFPYEPGNGKTAVFYFQQVAGGTQQRWMPAIREPDRSDKTPVSMFDSPSTPNVIAVEAKTCPTNTKTLIISFHAVDANSRRIDFDSALGTVVVKNPAYQPGAN